MAEITIDVTDALGNSRDRLEGTITVEGATTDLYHLRHGDTVTLTCDNTRGDESVILTLPNNVMIQSDKYTSTDITMENFINGTYHCNVNNPTVPHCPSSNDMVVLHLIGELSCKCCFAKKLCGVLFIA